MEWFRKSAEQLHAGAQCALALCYRDGYGLEKSAHLMVHHLKVASLQGHADAAYALALCYRDGTGTDRDIVEARRLLEYSAEQGNEDAEGLLEILEKSII